MENFKKRKNFKIRESIYLLLLAVVFFILLAVCSGNSFLLILFLGISILLFFFGIYENTHLEVRDLIIESDKIPESFENVKIIFFADIQLDYFFAKNRKRIKKIIDTINKTEPDIILFGGDFINKARGTTAVFQELKSLKAKKDIFMVYGNHDYYDFERISRMARELGIIELRNKNVLVSNFEESIVIAGIDDYRRGKPDIEETFSGIKEEFTILLCHNPDYFEEMPQEYKKRTGITLSGHTHGGQINLFGFAPFIPSKYGQKYRYGLKQFDGSKIYITSGIGAVTMPLRFLIRPEIINLKLRKKTETVLK